MKPNDKKPEIVFRIIDRESGDAVGSYSRACCDEYDFESVSQARVSNCHGVFKDKKTYKIAKYRVTYELIEDDVDGCDMPEPVLPYPLNDFKKIIDALDEYMQQQCRVINGVIK